MSECHRNWLHLPLIAVVALSWASLIANSYVKNKTHEAVAARKNPLLLYGSRLPISEATSVQLSADDPNPVRRHLILAFEDECPYCKRNRSNWQRLLSLPQWPKDSDVWLIPLSGGLGNYQDMVELASQRSIPLRVLKPIRPLFTLRTGLAAVPATVIVDETERVRLVRVGVMAPTDLDLFAEALRTQS
jgi:hypothetical protein